MRADVYWTGPTEVLIVWPSGRTQGFVGVDVQRGRLVSPTLRIDFRKVAWGRE